MFDTLLQLPLFQGLTQDDFTSILEKVKIHFTKHKPGEWLVKKGDPCNRLLFALKGEIAVSTAPQDDSYLFIEYLRAPFLFEPQALFGMNTYYISAYQACTEVHLININKAAVVKELFRYEIFRLNYMNIISNRCQLLHNRIWNKVTENTVQGHIIGFIMDHVDGVTLGKKVLKIKMNVLAPLINETRISVSKALNEMQERGVIELHRGEIVIPDMQRLRSFTPIQ